MAFWKDNSTLPKRNFRFKVTMGRTSGGNADVGSTVNTHWWAKTIKLPAFSSSPVELDYLDNKYYFPGRITWEDVTMTLVDPSDPDAVSILLDMLTKAGYQVKGNTTADGMATINKLDSANITITIDVLNEDGTAIESWSLNNAMIITADLGTMDYSSDDLREVSVTLKYDWATCTINGVASSYFPAATTTS